VIGNLAFAVMIAASLLIERLGAISVVRLHLRFAVTGIPRVSTSNGARGRLNGRAYGPEPSTPTEEAWALVLGLLLMRRDAARCHRWRHVTFLREYVAPLQIRAGGVRFGGWEREASGLWVVGGGGLVDRKC
jgi:hypothetical protein